MNNNEIVLKTKLNTPFTTAKIIADEFGKQHKHVLDAVNNIKSAELSADLEEYFIPTFYTDSMNRKQPTYAMKRDGFSLLVMGFTGKEALKFKIKFIEAFNKMEEFIIKELQPKQLSPNELILSLAQNNVVQEKQLKALEAKSIEQDIKINKIIEVQSKAIDDIKEMETLPEPKEEVPEIRTRKLISKYIAAVCLSKNIDYQKVWRHLYKEFDGRYNINTYIRAKNRGISKLDYIEKNGYIDKLYALVMKLYPINPLY